MIETHHAELDGLPVVWRSAPSSGPPTLWLHGVPDSSELWTPFLERVGGVAPDLPGFGRSAKRGDLDYSIGGYADWLERFCELARIERMRLAMHDWGAVGLAFAQRAPERIARIVAVDTVPLLPGYRWHPWRASGARRSRARSRWDSRSALSCAGCCPPAAPSRCSCISIRGRSGRSCGCTARAHPSCSPRLDRPELVERGAQFLER